MMRKTLLDIAKSVCGELSLTVPINVVSSTDLLTTQVYYLIQAALDELIHYHDWQVLTKVASIPMTGVEGYTLPSDVSRILPGTFTYTNGGSGTASVAGSVTPQTYQGLVNPTYSGVANYLTFNVAGDKINVYPSSLTGGELRFVYITTNCVFDGLTYKTQFTQDSDVCLFDARLVIALTKLKLLQAKGLDTSAASQDFNYLLEVNKGRDVPAPILSLDACMSPLNRPLPYTIIAQHD